MFTLVTRGDKEYLQKFFPLTFFQNVLRVHNKNKRRHVYAKEIYM